MQQARSLARGSRRSKLDNQPGAKLHQCRLSVRVRLCEITSKHNVFYLDYKKGELKGIGLT